MRIQYVLVFLLAAGLRSASAETVVRLDLAAVFVDGQVAFADDFDDEQLGAPPWLGVGDTPMTETGSAVEMREGNFIVAPVATNSAETTIAWTRMELTTFDEGSLASMVVLGDDDTSLFLGVVPGFAFLADHAQGLLGLVPLPAAASVDLVLAVNEDGSALAIANEEVVYSGATGLAGFTGIGFVVVPEPSSFVIMGIGLSMCFARRSSRRVRGGARIG